MPNWVQNKVVLKGTREDLNGFLMLGLTNSGHYTESENTAELTALLKEHARCKGVKGRSIVPLDRLCARTFYPMPDTYLLYDTTNHPDGAGLKVGKPEYWDEGSPIVTEEMIEEYKAATKEQKEKYGCVGWYDYNCNTLGTKWDFELDCLEARDGMLVFDCDTAWSTPVCFLYSVKEDFPGLRVFVCSVDEGWNFADYGEVTGRLTFRLIKDACSGKGPTRRKIENLWSEFYDDFDLHDER